MALVRSTIILFVLILNISDTRAEDFNIGRSLIAECCHEGYPMWAHPTEVTTPHLSFVSVTKYLTDRADRFSFEIEGDVETPDVVRYWVSVSRGQSTQRPLDDDSRIWAHLTVLNLPYYVELMHRQIYHRTGRRQQIINLPNYRSGYTGLAIVEILGYQSGGDDDFGYRIQTENCIRSLDGPPRVIVNYGFDGDEDGDLIFRVTQLQWRSDINVFGSCRQVPLAVECRQGSRVDFTRNPFYRDLQGMLHIPVVTTYWPGALDRNSGDADDDMSFDVEIDSSGGGYLEGKYTRRGNLELTVYEMDIWNDCPFTCP